MNPAQPDTPAADKQHIPLLDGMRGYAALAVVLTHMMAFFHHALPVEAGILAVDLFFIMSGVVIEKSYGQSMRMGTMTFKDFVRKRLIRLYPLYIFAALLGLVTYGRHLPDGGSIKSVTATAVSILTMTPQFIFGIEDSFGFNNPSWSLSIELYGGIIFAAISFRLRSKTIFLISVAGFLWLTYGAAQNGTLNLGPAPTNFHYGIARFTCSYPLGILIWRHREQLTLPIAPASILLALSMCFPSLPANDALRLIWIALVMPLGVISSFSIPTSARAVAACNFLGRLSYPIYIVHVPVLTISVGLMSRLWGQDVWHSPAAGIAALGAILVATLITTYWLEAPLRRGFTRLLDRGQALYQRSARAG